MFSFINVSSIAVIFSIELNSFKLFTLLILRKTSSSEVYVKV